VFRIRFYFVSVEFTARCDRRSNNVIADHLKRFRVILKRIPWALEHELRTRFGFVEREEALEGESQRFWNGAPSNRLKRLSHWRGAGKTDDTCWQAMGREHLEMYRQFCSIAQVERPVGRVVDWGCGGGANAILFAGETETLYGVDISRANLDECARQLDGMGFQGFQPILIDVKHPEGVFDSLQKGSCDFFLCTYVFELIPSPEYGVRILNVARDLLKEGGGALIQFRYRDGRRYYEPKRWGYSRNVISMTSYRLDDFWRLSVESGLKPLFLRLRSTDPYTGGGNYGYLFALKQMVHG